MKRKHLLALTMSLALGIGYVMTGCGDDEVDVQGTCEAGCNRVLRCADTLGLGPEFSVQACIAECTAEDPEKIACAGGCDAAPDCLEHAACLGGCGLSVEEG